MKITISHKHFDSTEAIDDVTRRKSEKLEKYFEGKIHLHWNFAIEKQAHIAHCNLVFNQVEYFAEASTDSLYSAIDEVITKLERQVRKRKEITKEHKIKNFKIKDHKIKTSAA